MLCFKTNTDIYICNWSASVTSHFIIHLRTTIFFLDTFIHVVDLCNTIFEFYLIYHIILFLHKQNLIIKQVSYEEVIKETIRLIKYLDFQ